MVSPFKEPEYTKEYRRQYYIKNKERERALGDTYISIPINYYRNRHSQIRYRAKKANLEFDLTVEDIIELCSATYCPLLGTPLMVAHEGLGKGHRPDAPSIDRIDPSKGYTKNNVWTISKRANTIKQDSTWQELYQLALNLKTKIESMEDEQTTTEEAEHPTE